MAQQRLTKDSAAGDLLAPGRRGKLGSAIVSDRTRLATRAQLGRDLAFARQQVESLEAQLRQLSRQEALLLQELNHRVGNNLAVLLGILDRERSTAQGSTGSGVSLKLSRFIHGLAVVHRLLSETGWRPLRLAMLCRAVLESVTSGAEPAAHVRVTDASIEVPSQVADRIAVVLSELAINSLGHCQGLAAVDIEVCLRTSDDQQIILEYRDSGPGYPSSVLKEASMTRGLGLVSEIARQGLAGHLTLSNDSGAKATLTFSALGSCVSSSSGRGAARLGAVPSAGRLQ